MVTCSSFPLVPVKLLTPQPLLDNLVFRNNNFQMDHFRNLFRVSEAFWSDIPFRNEDPISFELFSTYPDHSDSIRDPLYHHTDPRPDWTAPLEEQLEYEEDDPCEFRLVRSSGTSSSRFALSGSLSKWGREFRKSYLLVVPNLGRLYLVRNCLRFHVDNHLLLRSQSTPGGLERLINHVYRRLWNLFGLWFWISDLDISLDVAAAPAVMDDLRLAQHRGHRLLSGSFARHSVKIFDASGRMDMNGYNIGTRRSRIQATVYDRDVRLANATGQETSRLRRQKTLLEELIYCRPVPAGRHVLRTEFKLSELHILSTTGDNSRPVITSPGDLPPKPTRRHHPRTYRRVYWNQLDLVSLYRSLLVDSPVFRSDLSAHRIRHGNRASAQSMTQDNLRKIRDLDPDRFRRLLHPYYRLLLDSVSGVLAA